MNDVMVDIETTGTRPDRNSIIQIAAWKFDLGTLQVDPQPFDRCLWPMRHRAWDEGTRSWWRKQGDTLKGIMARAECPRIVLQDFLEWCPRPARLWAKPTSFEHPFLESHFHDAEIPYPFHYGTSVDVRSWIRGLLRRDDITDVEKAVEFVGAEHDARWDTLHQLRIVFAAKELAGG